MKMKSELSVMVIVDEPSGTYTMGGSVAAPLGAKILKICNEYYSSQNVDIGLSSTEEMSGKVLVPDMRGKELTAAKELLDTLGIRYEVAGSESGIITAQDIILAEYTEGTIIKLTVSENGDAPVEMPQLKGMSVSQATNLLSSLGLECTVKGGGVAVSQSIAEGTQVERGTVVEVTFEYLE